MGAGQVDILKPAFCIFLVFTHDNQDEYIVRFVVSCLSYNNTCITKTTLNDFNMNLFFPLLLTFVTSPFHMLFPYLCCVYSIMYTMQFGLG